MNFKQYYLSEMPHGTVNNVPIDFELEKPNWNTTLLNLIKTTKDKDINELLKPFYQLKYNEILLKRFNQLNDNDKNELLNVLPNQFINDMKLKQQQSLTLYHGSNVPITKFDRNYSAQGVFWFSEDKDKILKGDSGASSTNYLITAQVKINNTAGWDLYDKLSLHEINDKGYDSIKLDDDYIIFDAKNIKITKVEKLK